MGQAASFIEDLIPAGNFAGGGDRTKPTKPSGGGFAQYAPIATSLIGMAGTASDIDAQNDALMDNLQNEADALNIKQAQKGQQLQDLDRVLADKMSSSGLEALKAESKLKAASAETGTTGGSNTEAIQTAQVNKMHRDAATMRIADVQKSNKFSEMAADRLNFESTTETMLSGQQSGTSAGLSILGSGLQGINQGLKFMSQADRERFFGTNTTGE